MAPQHQADGSQALLVQVADVWQLGNQGESTMKKFRIFVFVMTLVCIGKNVSEQNWKAVMGWVAAEAWLGSIIYKDNHES